MLVPRLSFFHGDDGCGSLTPIRVAVHGTDGVGALKEVPGSPHHTPVRPSVDELGTTFSPPRHPAFSFISPSVSSARSDHPHGLLFEPSPNPPASPPGDAWAVFPRAIPHHPNYPTLTPSPDTCLQFALDLSPTLTLGPDYPFPSGPLPHRTLADQR